MDNYFNESIELFLASLDEKLMEEIIEIYENGDKNKLNDYLNKLPNNVPKKELIKNLEMFKKMKDMMGDLD